MFIIPCIIALTMLLLVSANGDSRDRDGIFDLDSYITSKVSEVDEHVSSTSSSALFDPISTISHRDDSQLVNAILSRQLQDVDQLLTSGTDPYHGSTKTYLNIVGTIETSYAIDDAPIFIIIKYDYYEAVILFIKHNVDWNVKNSAGFTPLLMALSIGAEDIAIALIRAGADIFANIHGSISPLIIASQNGLVRVVDILLEKKVLVEHRSVGGDTALAYAAGAGHVSIINLLISHNADLSSRNDLLATPLMIAVSRNRIEAVKVLLSHMIAKGVDINGKDISHRSAFDIAVSRGNQVIIDELAAVGCDIGKRYVFLSAGALHRRQPHIRSH